MLRNLTIIAAAVTLGPVAARAAPLNVPVASRVLAFVRPPLSGVIQTVILFEPGNADSEAEAVAIEQQLAAGRERGVLRVRRVPASGLAALSGVRVVFVTTGVREQQQLADFASRSAALTITSDLGCVQAGRCVLSISGTTRTQIAVSRAAAQACRVSFGSAFLMLVKEY